MNYYRHGATYYRTKEGSKYYERLQFYRHRIGFEVIGNANFDTEGCEVITKQSYERVRRLVLIKILGL